MNKKTSVLNQRKYQRLFSVTAFVLFLLLLGFGGSAGAQVFFEDDFENNAVGTNGDDLALPVSSDGSHWGIANEGSGDFVTVSDKIMHTGNRSLKFFFQGNSALSDDAWAEQRFSFGTEQSEVYVRFYIYFPDGTEMGENRYFHRDVIDTLDNSDNNKLLRIWHTVYSGSFKMGASFQHNDPIGESHIEGKYADTCTSKTSFPTLWNMWNMDADDLGRWICIEIRLKGDSGSGDGTCQVWVDGVYSGGDDTLVTSGAPCVTNTFLNGYLLGWSNSGFNNNTNIYIDDVAFSTSYIGPIDAPDLTPPIRSNPQPTGTLSSGTTSTTISLDTDETAECKYSANSGTNYDLMENTFTNTNSTDHSTDVSNLEDGNSYTYYIRCQDESNNQNPDDFEISFSIASSTTYSISNFINLVTDWLKSESGLESDVNGDGVVNTRDLGIMMSNWQE